MKVSAREILDEALFRVSKLRVLFSSTPKSRRPLEGLALWLGSIQYMQSPVETARDTIRQICEKGVPAHEGLVSSLRCSETWALVASDWDDSAAFVR